MKALFVNQKVVHSYCVRRLSCLSSSIKDLIAIETNYIISAEVAWWIEKASEYLETILKLKNFTHYWSTIAFESTKESDKSRFTLENEVFHKTWNHLESNFSNATHKLWRKF
jgi:hypothetical protein